MFEDVVTSAFRQRHDSDEGDAQTRPDPQATPEQFARWLAERHLSSDVAIDKVVYLPTGAPANEIRMLEVNRFLNPPETDVIEPLDFTPEMDLPYRVFVADMTSDQWERVQREPHAALPPGWRLDGYQIIGRV